MNHATIQGYEDGCRCDGCRWAQTERLWGWRSRKGRLGVHGPRRPRHGMRVEYIKHGCRCDACRAAEAAYRRSYRAGTK